MPADILLQGRYFDPNRTTMQTCVERVQPTMVGGETALSVAATQPLSLKAIIPTHATEDEFTGTLYPRGCRGGLASENDSGSG